MAPGEPARAGRGRQRCEQHAPPEHQAAQRERQGQVGGVEQRDVGQRRRVARRMHGGQQRAPEHQHRQGQGGQPVVGLGMGVQRPGQRRACRRLVATACPEREQHQHRNRADQQDHTGPRGAPQLGLADAGPQAVGQQQGHQPGRGGVEPAEARRALGGRALSVRRLPAIGLPQHPPMQRQHNGPHGPGGRVQHAVAVHHLRHEPQRQHADGGARRPSGHGPARAQAEQHRQGRTQHHGQHAQQFGNAVREHRDGPLIRLGGGHAARDLQPPGQAPEDKAVEVGRVGQQHLHPGIALGPGRTAV